MCWSRGIAYALELERQLECALTELRVCREKLAAATRELQERLTRQYECKICFDRRVEVVLLPCGHALCCVQCAPSLKNCPVCGEEVFATTVIHYQ